MVMSHDSHWLKADLRPGPSIKQQQRRVEMPFQDVSTKQGTHIWLPARRDHALLAGAPKRSPIAAARYAGQVHIALLRPCGGLATSLSL